MPHSQDASSHQHQMSLPATTCFVQMSNLHEILFACAVLRLHWDVTLDTSPNVPPLAQSVNEDQRWCRKLNSLMSAFHEILFGVYGGCTCAGMGCCAGRRLLHSAIRRTPSGFPGERNETVRLRQRPSPCKRTHPFSSRTTSLELLEMHFLISQGGPSSARNDSTNPRPKKIVPLELVEEIGPVIAN